MHEGRIEAEMKHKMNQKSKVDTINASKDGLIIQLTIATLCFFVFVWCWDTCPNQSKLWVLFFPNQPVKKTKPLEIRQVICFEFLKLNRRLPGATVGIGFTGSSVALGHNTTVSPSTMKVGGAGVLGGEGAVCVPLLTSNRSCSFPDRISTVYGPVENASATLNSYTKNKTRDEVE